MAPKGLMSESYILQSEILKEDHLGDLILRKE